MATHLEIEESQESLDSQITSSLLILLDEKFKSYVAVHGLDPNKFEPSFEVSKKTIKEMMMESKRIEYYQIGREVHPLVFQLWLRAIATLSFGGVMEVFNNMFTTAFNRIQLWFIVYIAVECNNIELVFSFASHLDNNHLWVPEESRIVSARGVEDKMHWWMYVVWRFLVNHTDDAINAKAYPLGLVDNEKWHADKASVNYGWTFLHYAAAWGDAKCMEKLLVYDAVPVNRQTKNSITPVHLAAYHGNATILEKLLEKDRAGAEVRDNAGRTPLHHASERGCLDAVHVLLKFIKETPQVIDMTDEMGLTALHHAACGGYATIVREILRSEFTAANRQYNYKVNRDLQHDFLDPDVITDKFVQREMKCFDYLGHGYPSFVSVFGPSCDVHSFWVPAMSIQLEQMWCSLWGFNILHATIVYGKDLATIKEIRKDDNYFKIIATAKDSLGLTPMDWAAAMESTNGKEISRFLLRETGVVAINAHRAKLYGYEIRRVERQSRVIQWTAGMIRALETKRWDVVRCMVEHARVDRIRIDELTWPYLRDKIRDLSCIHPWNPIIGNIMVELVSGGVLSKVLRECTELAIEHEMVVLTERTVEMSSKTSGGWLIYTESDQPSPLERASKVRGESGRRMVAAIEEHPEVRKLLMEERQACVEYSNTILVGAVLVAGLAFQAWVQTPEAYTGKELDATSDGLLVFSRCNSLSFLMASAAFMAGAVGAMPPKRGAFARYSEEVTRAASIASVLMLVAVVLEVVAFASVLIIAFTKPNDNDNPNPNPNIHFSLVVLGMVFICMQCAWFVARINRVRPLKDLFFHLLAKVPSMPAKAASMLAKVLNAISTSGPFRFLILYPFCAIILHPSFARCRRFIRDLLHYIHCVTNLFRRFIIDPLQSCLRSFSDSLERQKRISEVVIREVLDDLKGHSKLEEDKKAWQEEFRGVYNDSEARGVSATFKRRLKALHYQYERHELSRQDALERLRQFKPG